MRGRWTALVAVVALALVSCSSSTTSSGSTATTPTAERAIAWFGSAMEAVQPCQEGVGSVVDAIATFVASGIASDSSVDISMAAGQAIEACTSLEGDVSELRWNDLASTLPVETAALRAWVDAALAAEIDALVASSTNLDNRALIGRYLDAALASDRAAADFEDRVRTLAASLDVTAPTGDLLVRWNPPEH